MSLLFPFGRAKEAPASVPDRLSIAELLPLNPGEVEARVRHLSRDEIGARFGQDPWFLNYALSIWERANGIARLSSRPWQMTLSVVASCNADCQFCTVPLRQVRNPALELDLDRIPHLIEMLRYNKVLIITGGEPTIHPRFGKLLEHLKDVLDPRAYIMMITHGHRLHKFKAQLEALPVNLQISINAANAKTHHALMRLGEDAFDQIVASARWARSIGRNVEFSMVVVRENLAEVPAVLRLAEEIGALSVYLRTLIPGNFYAARFESNEEFSDFAAWSHPDFERLREEARAAIAQTSVQIYTDTEQWGMRLQNAEATPELRKAISTEASAFRPVVRTCGQKRQAASDSDTWRAPSGNPYNRKAPFRCDSPWHVAKLLEQDLRVDVCGFLQHVQGHDDVGLFGAKTLDEIWNAPALVHVRESLLKGPLLPECELCPYQMTGDWMSNAQPRSEAEPLED